MNRKDYLESIKKCFVRLVTEIKVNNSLGHFDINSIAENVYIPILSYVFSCPDLINLNRIEYNYPAVDLGCTQSNMCFQITSQSGSEKVINTLQKYKEHGLDKEFDRIIIYIITEKQIRYQSKKLMDIADEINFDVANDIQDYSSILAEIDSQSTEYIKGFSEIIEQEVFNHDKLQSLREKLDQFLELSNEKIEIEKSSKKYIPQIFCEASKAKDKARVFSHPLFFHRKLFDTLKRVSFFAFYKYLKMLNIEPPDVETKISDLLADFEGSLEVDSFSYEELTQSLITIQNAVGEFKSILEPYSGRFYHRKGKELEIEVPPEKKDLQELLKYKISGSIYKAIDRIDEALSITHLCISKVLLVTSMAGQGKTNFVCDFTENFCRLFDVPTIYIPARELNRIKNHDIFTYLVNNRYLNSIKQKFELLSLFNTISKGSKKPFLIIIDGINEIRDLPNFNDVLIDFIDSSLQFNGIKFIITCRTEFFNEKFKTFKDQFNSLNVYHISDLKEEMSAFHLERALRGYFSFFDIKAELSEAAKEFLKSDFLLLRIFCQNNQNTNLGHVSSIYKEKVFEEFLINRINQFSKNSRGIALKVLYKIVEEILDLTDASSISVSNFEPDEREVIELFIQDDVILRREVPEAGLSGVGAERINFTYDELRDFLIAHYCINELWKKDPDRLEELIINLKKTPSQIRGIAPQSFEGVGKFIYILARKYKIQEIIEHFLNREDFAYFYSNILPSLSHEYHDDRDLETVNSILKTEQSVTILRPIAVYLHNSPDSDNILNITILIEHINTLSESDYRKFMDIIFDRISSWLRYDSEDKLDNYISSALNNLNEDSTIDENRFAFILQTASLAHGANLLKLIRVCRRLNKKRKISNALSFIENAKAVSILRVHKEITSEEYYV